MPLLLNVRKLLRPMKHLIRYIVLALLLSATALSGAAQQLSEKYNNKRPVVIVCDWDKAPYEYLNDKGQPAGSNIDVLSAVMNQLGLPYEFVMKDWSIALKMFERGDADIILANARRYRRDPYVLSENIVNYNRIRVAMHSDSVGLVSLKQLEHEGAVLKPGDYSASYFMQGDSLKNIKMEFQTPKVALIGLINGDYQYYVWGEEPLKWKIKELNLEGIILNDVGIPISEIHIVGRDRQLIEQIDDQYSRLKQKGEIAALQDRWFHPERVQKQSSPIVYYVIAAIVLLVALGFLFVRLAKAHVRSAVRQSTELNEMMYKALHMGNFDVMEYDIKANRMTNCYGNILPKEGLTLEEYINRIHPNQREEFRQKMDRLIEGRERQFVLNKLFNSGTADEPHWLSFHGHAICELDNSGHPAYVVNAVHDVTLDMEEGKAERELVRKYEQLSNIPFIAMSFYDKDGWLIDLNDNMKELCGMSDDNPEAKRYWETVCMFNIPLFRNVYSPDDHTDLLICQHMEYPELGVDRYIEFNILPIFNRDGETANYFVTTLDVTEDRNADHLRHQQNRELMAIRKEIDVQKQDLDFLLKHSDRHLLHNDDGNFKIDVDTTKLETAKQKLSHVTELANESVKLKSGFMASMTHELRTPLNAIVGFTGVLDSLRDSPDRAEYVRIIRNSSDMLQRLINDITDASSISGDGIMTIKPEEIDFALAFDDICLTLEQRVKRSGVEFIKENPYESFVTSVDFGRIQQVLTNFVTNAVKFTSEGQIRLGYRYEKHGLYLYCQDTGCGIPKDKQEIIFDRFVKLDEFSQGTGMGLAICKSIVDSCKGEIGVISKGDGKGSTFWLWVPCDELRT